MMKEHSRDLQIGLFTLIGLAVLGALILMYGKEPGWLLTTRYKLSVLVDSPTGIRQGTPAYLQGVPIGRVDDIRFRDPQQPTAGAAVVVGVEKQYEIPVGWQATIHPGGLGLSQGEIRIHPAEVDGEPTTAPAEPAGFLPQDDTATIEGTMAGALDSIVPPEYIETLGSAVNQIATMAEKVGVVLDDWHELFKLAPVERVDDPSQKQYANLSTLVERLNTTIKLVNESLGADGDLHGALGSLGAWAANLDARTQRLVDQADSTMGSIRQQVDHAGRQLTDTLGEMSRVLDQLNAALTAVNEGQGVLGKLVHDQRLYEELLDSLDELQFLISDLRKVAVWLSTESRLAPGGGL